MPEPTAVATIPATAGTTVAVGADALPANATTAATAITTKAGMTTDSSDIGDLIEDVSIDGMCGVY